MGEGLQEDREQALRLTPVSRETAERLDRFVECLLQFQQHTNLIAPSTIPTLWTRHIADSLQLLRLTHATALDIHKPLTWVDLGSGGGFPGLVIACALADRPGAIVHLVESTKKKATFLEDAARHVGVRVRVHPVRIEDFVKNAGVRPDVVSARALAPLDKLFGLAHPLLTKGAQGLFPKGQDVEGELTEASKYWTFEAQLIPSLTNPLARIVVVIDLKRRAAKR